LNIELPEKIRIAERAAMLYEIAIPGLQLACVLTIIGFILNDFRMMSVGFVVGIAGLLIGEVAKYYKRKVMGP